MKYIKPNFEHEWDEATRYPFFEEMGKEEWFKFVMDNSSIKNYSDIKNELGNVDLDFENLKKEKQERFLKNFKSGKLELPIAVKIYSDYYDLVAGNTRIAGLVKNKIDPKILVIDATKVIPEDEKFELEETGADSAGAFDANAFGPTTVKGTGKLSNAKEYSTQEEFKEATDSSSAGAFDVPLFGSTKGRRDPLRIDGEKSIMKSRAVVDKKFPKWGGPGSKFVRVKDKCKKFPYCNQGNTGAIEMYEAVNELRVVIENVAKKHGISVKDVEKLVLNDIKDIFI